MGSVLWHAAAHGGSVARVDVADEPADVVSQSFWSEHVPVAPNQIRNLWLQFFWAVGPLDRFGHVVFVLIFLILDDGLWWAVR